MKYEIYYNDGGHGGPYPDLPAAIEGAQRRLNANCTQIECRPYNSTERGAFKTGNPGSHYVTKWCVIDTQTGFCSTHLGKGKRSIGGGSCDRALKKT